MNAFTRLAAVLAGAFTLASPALAQDPIKIAVVQGMSGSSLEAFSRQSLTVQVRRHRAGCGQLQHGSGVVSWYVLQ